MLPYGQALMQTPVPSSVAPPPSSTLPKSSSSSTAGVLGVIYELLCIVTTSLGQTLEISAYLAIIPDLQ